MALTCLFASLASAPHVWIQTNGGTFNWADNSNWYGGSVPGGVDHQVYFTNSLGANQTVLVAVDTTMGELYIGSLGNNFDYTFGQGGSGRLIFSNSTGNAILTKLHGGGNSGDTIQIPMALQADLQVSNTTAGGLYLRGSILEAGPRTVHVESSTGTGFVGFYQTNRFSGGIWLRAGSIVVGTNGVGATNTPLASPFGTGDVNLAGGWLRPTATLSNLILLNPVKVHSNSTFNTYNNFTPLTLAGRVTLMNGNRSLKVDLGNEDPNASLLITGSIVDNGNGYALIKSGGGNLLLAGSNDYTGGTVVSNGWLILSNTYAIGTNGLTNYGNVSLSLLNGGTATIMGFSNALAGTGTNVVLPVAAGTGSATLYLDGNYSAFTGTWLIGLGATAATGKVRVKGLDHAAASFHVLTNATLWEQGGTHLAAVTLYGGTTGEPIGQFRVDGNANHVGPVYIAGAMSGAGNGTIGAASSRGIISGTISEIGGGNWGLSRSGSGTNALAGTNVFSGPLEVYAGTLEVLASPASSGAGPLGSNAQVTLSNSANVLLKLSAPGRVGGLSGGGALGGWVSNQGYSLTVGANDGSTANYAGIIGGTGNLIKVGSNTQVFSGSNLYSGGTLLSNGIILVGTNCPLGTGLIECFSNFSRIQMTNGTRLTNAITMYGSGFNNTGHGVLDLTNSGTAWLSQGTITVLGTTWTGGHLAGNLVVSNPVVVVPSQVGLKSRSGKVIFSGTNSWNYLDIGFDDVALGRDDALPTNSIVRLTWESTGTSVSLLDMNGFHQRLQGISNGGTNGSRPVIFNSSTTSDSILTLAGTSHYFGRLMDCYSGNGTRRLHLFLDGGNLTAVGTNSWSGLARIHGGTLRAGLSGDPGKGGAFGSNAAIFLSNSPGSVLDVAGFQNEIGSLSGGGTLGGTVALNGGTLTVGTANTNTVFDGAVTGTGTLVKTGSGTWTLTGTHTHSGETLVTNGHLVLSGAFTGGTSVVVSNGGAFWGNGAVTGAVTVGMGGLLAPGLPGTNGGVFSVGSVAFQNGARFVLDLDGSSSTNDRLVVQGDASLGGILVATNVQNCGTNVSFVILQASNLTGTFAGIPDNGFLYQGGRLFQVRYSATNVTLRDIGNMAPPPILEVTNPAPFTPWNGLFPIAGVATNQDPSLALPTVWVKTNGGAWVSLGSTNEWALAHGASNLTEGTNLFSVLAFLSNGITNQIWITNVVDLTAPVPPTLSASTNSFVAELLVTFAATDVWGLDRIFYTLDGSVPGTNGTWVLSGGTVTLSNDAVVVARARDLAGNLGATNTFRVTRIPNPTGTGVIGSIVPNPWRPGNGPLRLQYRRPNLDRVEVQVFDMQGRLVAEMKAVSDGALYVVEFQWDGKTVSGQTVGRGMYLAIPRVSGILRGDLGKRIYLP